MRPSYFTRFALIVGWQAGMTWALFRFGSPQHSLTNAFVTSGLLIPFIGYFLAFYRAPAFAKWSRIQRLIILATLFSFITLVGFWFLLFLMFVLFMAFGGHHW